MNINELERPTVIHTVMYRHPDTAKLVFINYDNYDDANAHRSDLEEELDSHMAQIELRRCDFDPDEITKLLDGMGTVPAEQWNQCEYMISEPQLAGGGGYRECGACAAVWAAYFAPKRRKLWHINHQEGYKWWMDDTGVTYLSDLTALHTKELRELFIEAGARSLVHTNSHDNPFGATSWGEPLYDVFSKAFFDRFGFRHQRTTYPESIVA